MMDDDFAYLTTTGRRSGEPHEIEIWYSLSGDTLWMLAGGRDGSDWVRNLRADPSCRIRLGSDGVEREALASFPEGTEESAAREALFEKYQPRVDHSLERWRTEALVVALNLGGVPSRTPPR